MRALLIVLLAGVCMPLWVYGGGQKAAEPTPETGTTEQIEGLGEAPMLAEMVARGELPPVEERLPEDVLVLEPEEEIGQYGGTLRMVANGPGHGNLKMLMYDVPVRWNRDLTGYEPNLFKDWVYSEDGTAVTFFLRRGVKWSDGAPFTTDDIRFWWEDLALNEDFGDVPFPGWGFLRGERMTVDIVDDFTVRFNFAFPNWMLPYTIAQGFWVWEAMMTPRHYLEQFHPDYNSDIEDYTLLGEKRLWHQNPDHPVLFAWRPVEYEAGVRLVVERNPYYWKVDTAGNQLPYIDRIIDEEVTDPEVRLLKLLAGEIDASWRTATSYSLDIPVILEAAPDVGLRYLDGFVAGEGSAPGIMINQDFAEDEYVRDVLRNKHFRRALSHAIDRDHINDVVWLGMGEITGGTTASKQAIHFQSPDGKRVYEEWQNAYTEYDVALSNKLLDDFGLTKRDPATGYRVRQDTGEVLELIITDSAPLTTPGGAFLGLIESYWEEIGLKTTIDVIPNAAAGHNTQEGLFHFFLWWGEPQDGLSELDLFTYPENVFVTGLYWRNWPLQGKWFASGGSDGWEPGPIAQGLYDLYASALSEPDMEKRHTYVHEAIRKYWIDEGPFHIAATRGLPMPVFVKENLRNVPNYGILSPWAPACPGSQDPPQWFFEQD
jgi:peptide/nickel transport system substrate-binding protein